MAVAVKNNTDTRSGSPATRLAVASLVGAVYVLGALVVVFYGVPRLWDLVVGNALAGLGGIGNALEVILAAGAGVGLIVLGQRLAGHPPAGIRAGITLTIAAIFAAFGIAVGVGEWLLRTGWLDPASPVGPVVMVAVGVGLLVLYTVWLRRPAGYKFLTTVEEQGWFSAARYKRSQGLRARRLTMLGIIALAGWGIIALLGSPMRQAWPDRWTIDIPFTDYLVTVLRDPRYTVPLLLAGLALWFAWRVVNWPLFADFLIATEAEINKVSWSSRRKLIQDTIVVLVTVLLFTLFLLVVDQFWGFVLSKGLGIIPSSSDATKAKAQQQQDQIEW
jgi:preprotein translocase SecE subunit